MNEIVLISNNISKNFELNFSRYLQEIQKFPLLEAEEEYEYALRVVKNNDSEAAKILIQSHLRLVAKIAFQFKNYGLVIADLVSEGNIGLIKAVKKFDPEKGFRFSTYAMLWIKAYIQEYILCSWSLVKIGTTVAQKKIFFNLQKVKRALGIEKQEIITDTNLAQISNELNVSKQEVINMDSRITNSDSSLNNIIGENEEVGNLIAAEQPLQDEIVIHHQEFSRKSSLVNSAMKILNNREKDILIKRKLLDKPMTLAELSKNYNISRERVRQIEASAINKIKKQINE